MDTAPKNFYATTIACLFSLWLSTSQAAMAESGSFPLSYSGRLTQADGAPLSGPVDVTVKFWSAAAAGNPLTTPIEFANTSLNHGLFTVSLDLNADQVNSVFGHGTDPVFIEITAAGKTYPRQQYTYVPFALRIPVDAKTLAFDSDGKLGLSLTSQPTANQFLTKDSSGRLTWGSPAVTTLQGQNIADTAPTSGQVLTYSGGQWIPQTLAVAGAAGGTVTNVSGTAPLTVSTGTTTPVISMAQASGSANGYLSSADWTTFNAKPGAAVTSVSTGTGLIGGPITTSGTISLNNTSVIPGSYARANISVDAQGRLTAAFNGASVNLTSEVSGTLPVGNGGTGAASFTNNGILVGSGSLPVSTVTGAQYQVLTASAGGTPSFGSLNLDQSAAVTGILPRANGGTGLNSSATFPSYGVIVTEGAAETLTNKTLSAATIDGASSIGGSTTINTTGTINSGAATVAGNVTILGNSTTANKLVLNDKGSTNSVALKAPDNLASSLTLELPSTNGSSGQVLATNGSGNLSWVSAATGSVTNVTGTSPISVSTGNSTPLVSMSQANGTTNGYLSSADWTTFNSKQAAGNYLTGLTGDVSAAGPGSASATLAAVAIAGTSTKVSYDVKGRVTSGTSLTASDIPPLSAAVITSGTLTVVNGGTGATTLAANNVILGNGTSAVQTVAPSTSGNVLTSNGTTWQSTALPSSVTNVTGTAPISVATGTSTPVISMTQANGSTNGYLSSADWTTFNSKQASGSYISALTGDVTATGPGSTAATLAAIAIAGTSTKVTYDVKGRVTSGTSLTAADLPSHSAALITSGTLAVANGGTGLSATPTNGQIPIGNGTNYNLATLTAGTGISINNAAGAVTVSATADASSKVSKAGDTMTGSLTLPSNGLIAGTNQLVLANGNVGIGTTAPAAPMHLLANTGTWPNVGLRIDSGLNDTPLYIVNSSTGGHNWVLSAGGNASGVPNALQILDFSASATRMVVTNAGNVGIGTVVPTGSLHVNRDNTASFAYPNPQQLRITNNQSLTAGQTIGFTWGFTNAGNAPAAIHSYDGLLLTSISGSGLADRVWGMFDGSSQNEKMRLTSAGNVGIGTTAPADVLHVTSSGWGGAIVSSSSSDAGLTIKNTTTGGRNYSLLSSGTGSSIGSGNFNIYDNTAGLNRLSINSTGNVGIGTTAPSNALEVAGSIKSTSGGYKFPDGTTQTTVAGITGCPSGMTMVPADPSNGFVAYCIDSSNSTGVAANDAQIACQNAGKHLCRAQELYRASAAIALSCAATLWNGDGLNFWNGAQNFANYTTGASCNSNGWAPMSNTYPYRCCR